LRLNKGSYGKEYNCVAMFVDTTDYYPKCAFDLSTNYTLKENFTSSRFLKNENYTYLKL
jgi:hypothetical protein